uniref:Uncharacterized protein n=1 Tax=Sphaerodactylus townsendi TaxID=933632 RepID=A0ACB8EC57_9SAUR
MVPEEVVVEFDPRVIILVGRMGSCCTRWANHADLRGPARQWGRAGLQRLLKRAAELLVVITCPSRAFPNQLVLLHAAHSFSNLALSVRQAFSRSAGFTPNCQSLAKCLAGLCCSRPIGSIDTRHLIGYRTPDLTSRHLADTAPGQLVAPLIHLPWSWRKAMLRLSRGLEPPGRWTLTPYDAGREETKALFGATSYLLIFRDSADL